MFSKQKVAHSLVLLECMSGTMCASEVFAVMQLRMPRRILNDGRLLLVAKPIIKRGGLEIMCGEYDLAAALPDGFSFDGGHQGASKTLTAIMLVNPQMGDITCSTPGVARHARYDIIRRTPDCTGKDFAVVEASRLGVEFVDAVNQESIQLRVALTAELNG